MAEDAKYFGVMNTYPVLDALWKADMKEMIGRVRERWKTREKEKERVGERERERALLFGARP